MNARIAAGRLFLAGVLLVPARDLALSACPSDPVEGAQRNPPGSQPVPASPVPAPTGNSAAPTAVAEWRGPDFQFKDLRGLPHRLADSKGHVVLLEFWASWCLPCRKGFPFLDQLQERHAGEGLKVLAVTLETEDDAVESFVGSFPGMGFLIGRDPTGHSGELMQVEAMPTAFLLGGDGRILARFEGGGEAIHQQIEQKVEAALRGEAIAVPASGGKRDAGPKGNLKAWERGYLADPIMNLDGDVLKQSMREHIHASKEAAAGNGGVAGGGCGCN